MSVCSFVHVLYRVYITYTLEAIKMAAWVCVCVCVCVCVWVCV